MERRREIVNLQHNQAKNMIGNLPAGTEKPQIPEAFPLEGYIVVNGSCERALSEYFPSGHTMHTAAPAALKFPGPHEAHVLTDLAPCRTAVRTQSRSGIFPSGPR